MKAFDDGGRIGIEELRDVLKLMLGGDAEVGFARIQEGHNALAFDIDMLIRTIEAQPVYQNQSTEAAIELRELLGNFREKRFGILKPDARESKFAQDTLDTANTLMGVQRNRITEEMKNILSTSDSLKKISESEGKKLIDEITTKYNQELSLSPSLGAFKGRNSLENLILNTNFFELLEKEKDIGGLLEALARGGGHTADVDAILTSYFSEYVNNGRLQIRRLPTLGMPVDSLSPQAAQLLKEKAEEIQAQLIEAGYMRKPTDMYSQFEEYMRAVIARSSSVTPTTNVSDVSELSSELFTYLSQNVEGRKKMSISVTLDDLFGEKGVGLELDNLEKADIQSIHRDGSTVGKIRYRKPSGEDSGGYFFESDTSGFATKIENESAVGELIQRKMEAARGSKSSSVELFNSSGAQIGVVQNANVANDQIVDIGIRNFEHTQFNQTLSNLGKVRAGTIAVTPINASNIENALSTTQRFYGLNEIELPDEKKKLAKNQTAVGKVLSGQAMTDEERVRLGIPASTVRTKAEAYSDEVIRYALPYSEMDPSSRVVGVATSRATAREFATAIHRGENGSITLEGLDSGQELISEGLQNLRAGNIETTTSRLQKLADIAPINYAVAQGREAIYGYHFTLKKNGRETEKVFPTNLYFRMVGAKESEFKASEKIVMVAEDFLKLNINIGDKSIPINSPEFLRSAANRFVQSHVKDVAGDVKYKIPTTINLVFSPQNLTIEAYEDLANQVVGVQMSRFYDSYAQSPKVLAGSVRNDFNAISKAIFGSDYETTLQNLSDNFFKDLFAEGKTLAERAAMLEGINENAAAEKLSEYVRGVARQIRDDGIVAFKYMGESAENIIDIQRMSGNEALYSATDQQRRNITTRVSSFVSFTEKEGDESPRVIGATMAPFSSEEAATSARMAALDLLGEESSETAAATVARSMHASDVEALSRLQEATQPGLIPLVDEIKLNTELIPGTRVGNVAAAHDVAASHADEAFNAGRKFFQRNKTNIYLSGLAVAAAIVGTKMAKRKNENEVYDATMQGMPAESGQRPYGIQEALFSRKMASRRKDPLVTAGVVGNLDRNKINHTSMGSDKNSHLFGG
jgi:hypothetical protein